MPKPCRVEAMLWEQRLSPAADDKIVDTKLMMWRQKPSPSPALSNELETGSQMSRTYFLSRVTTPFSTTIRIIRQASE